MSMPLLSMESQGSQEITEMILDKHLFQLHQVADIPVLTGFGVSTQADVERFNAVSDRC